DVHEMAGRRRERLAFGEEPDLVAHAGRAGAGDPQAGLDVLRKGERCEVVAVRLYHQADHLAAVDVERTGLDQPAVHRAVEVAVVDDVVDVAVDVVVHPARLDRHEAGITIARLRLRAGGHGCAFCLPRGARTATSGTRHGSRGPAAPGGLRD